MKIMKVKELISKLTELDQELDVLCYTEDADLLPPGHMFRLLEPTAVSVTEGERQRGDDQVATLKLGKGAHSQRLASIEVTCDF
jgi:hypothetical protein